MYDSGSGAAGVCSRSMETNDRAPAAETVYRDYAPLVARLARRMIRNPQAAEDAVQEAWCEILGALPSFEGRAKLSTWIWTVARRAVLRHANREKTYSARFLRELFALNEDDGVPEMERIAAEDRLAWVKLQCSECLTAILHCVPNDDRMVYLLRRIAGLAYAEIAKIVGSNEAAVRQVFSRSARKIGRFLSGECVLYNPRGSCRCKMREPIRRADRTADYARLREAGSRLRFLDAADAWYAAEALGAPASAARPGPGARIRRGRARR